MGILDELFSLPWVVLSGPTVVVNGTNSENFNNSDVMCTTLSLGDTTEARLTIKSWIRIETIRPSVKASISRHAQNSQSCYAMPEAILLIS